MRKLIATLAAACAIALPAAAQMKPSATAPPTTNNPNIQITPARSLPLEAVRRISQEEAIRMVKEKRAVYVDVRSKEQYDLGHIKGAVSIPLSQLATRRGELPRDKYVITYCACVQEHTAAIAVQQLNGAGVSNTAALLGGWNSWRESSLPIETSAASPAAPKNNNK